MSYKEIEIDWLEELIAPAIDQFYATPRDHDLLNRDVSERAIVGVIFCNARTKLKELQTVNPELADLEIDLEYNRNLLTSKEVFNKCYDCINSECYVKKKKILFSIRRSYSYPDLIIHQRGSNVNNQVVIEFKKANNHRGRKGDEAKLTFFTCQKPFPNNEERNYQFRIGFFIDLKHYSYLITSFQDAQFAEKSRVLTENTDKH